MFFNDAFSNKKESLSQLNRLLAEIVTAIATISGDDDTVDDKKYREVLYTVNRANQLYSAMQLLEELKKDKEI